MVWRILVPIDDKCESAVTGLHAAGDGFSLRMAGALYPQIGFLPAGSAAEGSVPGDAAPGCCTEFPVSRIQPSSINRRKNVI